MNDNISYLLYTLVIVIVLAFVYQFIRYKKIVSQGGSGGKAMGHSLLMLGILFTPVAGVYAFESVPMFGSTPIGVALALDVIAITIIACFVMGAYLSFRSEKK